MNNVFFKKKNPLFINILKMEFKGIFFNSNDFQITNKTLGRGVFGTVYIAERLSDHLRCAAKIINIKPDEDGKSQMLIMRESSILSKLDHQSIIKFYGLNFQSLKDEGLFQPTIITEFMPNKSLKEILDKEKSGLAGNIWSPTKKYICLIGIADAMRYLHAHDILHRDLKPENILMDENYYPKVCDFGLSRCLPDSINSSMQLSLTGQIGTPLYMAPELIDMTDETKYGKEVDVYAFAILAYEIITGKAPFHELGNVSQIRLWNKVLDGERPIFTPDVPEKMQNLISRCWSKEPKQRPSFNEIFQVLSTDFSFSPETIDDEEEINDYLESLKDNNNDKDDTTNNETNHIINECSGIERGKYSKANDLNHFLYLACEAGNVEIVRYLLSNNLVDVNSIVILYEMIYSI